MIRFRLRHAAGLAVVMAALLFAVDHLPRFMVGDSQSYLATDWGSLPPDRSWIFGLLVNRMMALTHGLGTFVTLQAAALVGVAVAVAVAFPARTHTLACAAACMLAIVCDPLIEIYARFYLSDFSAAVLFAGFVGLAALQPTGRRRWFVWCGIAACGIGAVAFRLAYVPIELGTVALALLSGLGRSTRRASVRLAAVGCVPLLALGLQIGANQVVFAERFPGSSAFSNRQSSVFLMGVISPSLDRADLLAGGVTVSAEAFDRMRLADYDNRINQIWAAEPFWLLPVMRSQLAAVKEYDQRVSLAAGAIVRSAVLRHPWAVAEVLARSLLFYASPAEWRRHIDTELGVRRDLDGWFVAYVNRFLDTPLAEADPRRLSPLSEAVRGVIGAYAPILVLGGICALGFLLGARDQGRRLAAAALLATLAAAPLYSTYVIPRYMLAGLLFTWLLLPQALAEAYARARHVARTLRQQPALH